MVTISKSKEKQREYQKRYHDKNPEKKKQWNRDWINNNRERYYASKYGFRDKAKKEAIAHYSKGEMKCNYCGFNDIKALCLDHINDDGNVWRKENKISCRGITSGSNTCEVVRRLGYPEGFQVLCANCNLIKEINRKLENRLKNQWYVKRLNNSI